MERNSYYQSIKDNLKGLKRALELTAFDLMSLGLNVNELAEDIESIKKKTTTDRDFCKTTYFLEILLTQPEEVLKKVIEVLRNECDQKDFADILEGKSSPMSDEHCKLLDKNRDKICQNMNVSVQLLGMLVSSETFSQRDEDFIMSRSTNYEKAAEVIKTLKRKSDNAFGEFIKSLRYTGQGTVAFILIGGDDSEKPMSAEHRSLLEKNANILSRFINPVCGLLDELLHKGVFQQNELSSIETEPTIDDKAKAILKFLMQKPDRAYGAFIEALINTKRHPHVVYILTGDGEPPMSTEHLSLLREKENKLYKFLNPLNGLLEELISNGTFDEREKDVVESHGPIDDMAKEVVKLLKRKWDSAFNSFLGALDRSDQKHVVFIITEKGQTRPLSDFYVRLLHEKRLFLVENLSPTYSNLLNIMITKGVFSSYDGQWIQAEKTSNSMAARFLDILVRKSQSAYANFLQALEESNHSHVIEELERDKTVLASAELTFRDDVSVQLKKRACSLIVQHINSDDGINESLVKTGLLVYAERGSIKLHFTCLTEQAVNFLEYDTDQLDIVFKEKLSPILRENKIENFHIRTNSADIHRCRQNFKQSNLMTDEHRRCILSLINQQHMTDKLEVTQRLMQLLTIDEVRKQTVFNTESSRRSVVLLDIISRLTNKYFAEFLNALIQTNQMDIVRFFQYQSDCVLQATDVSPDPDVSTKWWEQVEDCCIDDEAYCSTLTSEEWPDQVSDCDVALFIDNSNLFIEGKKFHATRLKLLVDQDPCFRIDIGQLCHVLLKGRNKHIGKLYGSEPPALDTVWNKIRQAGLNVSTYLRDTNDKEKEVGNALSVDATEFVCKRRNKPGTIILVAGDRDYCPVVEKIMEYGWEVELAAFTKTINKKLMKLKENPHAKLKITLLEELAESYSSWFYVNRRFLDRVPNSTTYKRMPHSRTMVVEFTTPFNIKERINDVRELADKLTEITRVPCLFNVKCKPGSDNTNIMYIIGITSTSRLSKNEDGASTVFNQDKKIQAEKGASVDAEERPTPRMDFCRIWKQYEGTIRNKFTDLLGKPKRFIKYIDYIQEMNESKDVTSTANRFLMLKNDSDGEEDKADDSSEIDDQNCYEFGFDDQGYDTSSEISEISEMNTGFEEKTPIIRSIKSVKMTSAECPFSFCCMYGSRCLQQHTPNEKVFFKHYNGKGVKCYKSLPCCYHFNSLKPKSCNHGSRSEVLLCKYYHSSQEARCYLCKRLGGELGHAIDERHPNEAMELKRKSASGMPSKTTPSRLHTKK